MGDGDGGDAVDFAAADLQLDFGTETVEVAAGDPGDVVGDAIGLGGGPGDPGWVQPRDEDLVELTWIAPETHAGP